VGLEVLSFLRVGMVVSSTSEVCRPNAGRQLRRWRASEAWRTAARGSCQAMRVRPTYEAQGALGCRGRLKVAGCRVASRP